MIDFVVKYTPGNGKRNTPKNGAFSSYLVSTREIPARFVIIWNKNSKET